MLARPVDGYSSDDLAMLTIVLGEAVTAVIAGATITDVERQELSIRIGKVLMDSFVAGETDPAVLKKLAVDLA
jgi:hypothetical protein